MNVKEKYYYLQGFIQGYVFSLKSFASNPEDILYTDGELEERALERLESKDTKGVPLEDFIDRYATQYEDSVEAALSRQEDPE